MSRSFGARLAGLGVLCACLAACGGGGADGGTTPQDPGVAGDPYFPLAIGDRWRALEDGSASVSRVMDTVTINGTQTLRVHVEDAAGASDNHYAKTSSGVTLVPAPTDDELSRAVGPVEILRFPLRAGASHVAVDKTISNVIDADGDGRFEALRFRLEVTVVGFERLDTAVGVVDQALHTRTVVTESASLTSNGAQVSVTITTDDWYGSGIGPLRSSTVVTGPGGSQTSLWTLQAYRAGTRSSDTVAPTVLTRTPADGSSGSTAAVSLSFSEPMDRSSVVAGGLRVTGPGGATVTGELQWQSDTVLRFVPAAALADGSYSVTLASTAQDLLGNPLAAASTWQFSLDSRGPTVVAWTPADQSTDVAPGTAITITFDEAVDPASVTSANVFLSTNGTVVPAAVSVNGRVLTLTPAAALLRGASYTLGLGAGVRDLAGNTMTGGTSVGFVTDPGRFALPQALASLTASGQNVTRLEMADVDGDGLPDVLAVQSPGGFGGRLVWLRRAADGTLSAATPVAPFGSCNSADVVAADFDGDGLPDIAAVAPFCGLQWASQTPAGGFTLRATLDNSPSGNYSALRVLPLAGSTRPGLVVAVDNLVRLWRPGGAGAFAAPETLYTGTGQVSRMAVGDLNGDGRMDIVFAGPVGGTRGLVLLLQRADGGFDTQTIESPTTNALMALADVDGDGRSDLLVSESSPSTSLLLLRQTAAATLAEPLRVDFPRRPDLVRVADLNGDGRLDIVVGYSDLTLAASVATQQPDGRFVVSNPFEFGVPPALPAQLNAMLVGDFTGDGVPDILAGNLLLRQRPASARPSRAPGTASRLWSGSLRAVQPQR